MALGYGWWSWQVARCGVQRASKMYSVLGQRKWNGKLHNEPGMQVSKRRSELRVLEAGSTKRRG